ncbi:MAG TPA: diguanylate cyclase [Firmicutes bacterium]|nr:diguanylate cyclase [Bacillota bacterium]
MKKKDFEIEMERAKALSVSDPLKAKELLENLLATERISKEERARLLIQLGRSSRHSSHFRRALECFREALAIGEKKALSDVVNNALNGLGIVYRHLGDYEKALEEYFRLLALYEAGKEHQRVALTYNNIGVVYRHLKKPQKTLECYFKALDLYNLVNDEQGFHDTLNNIGLTFCDLGEYDAAWDYIERSLKLRQKSGNEYGVAISRHNLGLVSMKRAHYPQALRHYRASLFILHKKKDEYGIVKNLEALGECFFGQKRLNRALSLFLEAKKRAAALNLHELSLDLNQKISSLYEEKKDYEKALSFYKEYHQQSEELSDRNKEHTLEMIMMKHEIERERQETEIYRLRNIELTKAKTMIQMKKRQLEEAYEQLKELANHDSLTGLANRRYFMEQVHGEVARCERNKKSFVLIVGDLDGFKRYNDQFGHDCGDFLLQQVAETMGNVLRKQDMAARWGGEEFIILLPETTLKGGIITAEKINQALDRSPFTYDGRNHHVTMTLGVSMFSCGKSVSQVIIEADRALYLGKGQGKNNVKSVKDLENNERRDL